MTETDLKDLGFSFLKEYDHDQFHTKVFKKGPLEVDLTFEDGKMINSDFTIEEVFCQSITLDELKILSTVFKTE
jgi:hypothetical protein